MLLLLLAHADCPALCCHWASTAQTAAALMGVPQTRKRKRDAKTEEEIVKQQRNGQPPFPPEHYILKPQEMQALGYQVCLAARACLPKPQCSPYIF